MHFVIIGQDGTDEGAFERRSRARANHLEGIKQLKSEGKALYAAALLNEEGQMNGSIMVFDFPSRVDLDTYLDQEPYVKEGVWQKIEVRACQVGQAFMHPES